MNNAISHILRDIRNKIRENRHRHMIVISGERPWVVERTNEIVAQLELRAVIVSDEDEFQDAISINHFRSLLGKEFDGLVFDAYHHFLPDAFGATSGTVRSGGFLFLLLPPIDQWLQSPDKYLRNICNGEVDQAKLVFFSWLFDQFKSDKTISWLSCDGFHAGEVANNSVSHVSEGPTTDQIKAVSAILHVVNGHRKRPLVITADRGRGKSASLGMAAAKVLGTRGGEIIVTAPNIGAVETLFQHAHNDMPGSKRSSSAVVLGNARIRFIPPDVLCHELPPATLLLVDEAGAIHVGQLEKMTRNYSRVVFASTIHGYEGNGRGFAVRFLQKLDELCPGWKRLEMSQAIRWAQDDPLETLVNSALLLDADAQQATQLDIKPAEITGSVFTGQDIAQQPGLLQDVFGLLVTAHYQTHPNDLRLMLDSPNSRIFVMRHHKTVIAAALTAIEGNFSPEMALAVQMSRRRLHGEVLPQVLAQYVSDERAALQSYYRIIRIAVIPELQGNGFGSYLLEKIEHHAKSIGIDYLGANFGASESLVHFWQRNGYRPLRLGIKTEGATGEHSVLMIKAVTEDIFVPYYPRFRDSFLLTLSTQFNLLSPDIAVALLQYEEHDPISKLEEIDKCQIVDFAFGNGGYENCYMSLYHFAKCVIGTRFLKKQHQTRFIEVVLQNHKDSKQAIIELREILVEYLNTIQDETIEKHKQRYLQ